MTPRLSVILPVYNASEYISTAVLSILAQSYTDFELIVIDDHSTDDTLEILEGIIDSRIRLIKKSVNSGYVESLNLAVRISNGIYIARMDADDISLPKRFEKQVSFLNENPEVAAVATRIKLINQFGEIKGDWKNDIQRTTRTEIRKGMPFANNICHPSVMLRKSIFLNYQYDQDQYGSEDWDLWLRLLRHGYVIDKLDEVLLHYRQTDVSVSAVIDREIGVWRKANRVRKKLLLKNLYQLDFRLYDFKILSGLIATEKKILFGFIGKKLRRYVRNNRIVAF